MRDPVAELARIEAGRVARRDAISRAIIVLLREVAATYLDGLDLRCEHYTGPDHRPMFDGCPAMGRGPRGSQYGAEAWCLPCEVRERLGLTGTTPNVPVDKSTG